MELAMPDEISQTTASLGVTETPAIPAQQGSEVVPVATPESGLVDPQSVANLAQSMDPEGTPAGEAAVDENEPPAGSSPEQAGRWKKRTETLRRVEAERDAAKAEAQTVAERFQPIEPVLTPVTELIGAMTQQTPDTVSAIKALKAIDDHAVKVIAKDLLEEFGDAWVRGQIGMSLAEAKANLAAPGAPAQQRAAALSQDALEDIAKFVDPEVAQQIAAMQQRAMELEQLAQSTGADREQRTAEQVAAERREAINAYDAQFDPDVDEVMSVYKVDPKGEEAGDFAALLQKSIASNPEDLEKILKAREAHLEGRTYIAATGAQAVRAIIKRHAALIGERHYKHRLEAAVTEGQQAEQKAAEQAKLGDPPTGGSLTPGPPALPPPANKAERLAQLQAQIDNTALQLGYQQVGGKWVAPA